MSTFIIQASNSTRIHTLFTIEAKVGDFFMPSGERGVQRGVYEPESVKEGLNLKRDVICIFASTVRLKSCQSVVPR